MKHWNDYNNKTFAFIVFALALDTEMTVSVIHQISDMMDGSSFDVESTSITKALKYNTTCIGKCTSTEDRRVGRRRQYILYGSNNI